MPATISGPNFAALARSLDIAAIAAALPGEWTSEKGENSHLSEQFHGALIRADGLRLNVAANTYDTRGKVCVSYSRPSFKKGSPWVEVYGEPVPTQYGGTTTPALANPSMTCTLTKTPEQIASDIARRIIADSETVHSKVLAKIAQYENADAERLATLEAVCKAAGEKVPREWSGGEETSEPRFSLYVKHPKTDALHSVEVRSAECVHFTLDLSREKAVALIEWLRNS